MYLNYWEFLKSLNNFLLIVLRIFLQNKYFFYLIFKESIDSIDWEIASKPDDALIVFLRLKTKSGIKIK